MIEGALLLIMLGFVAGGIGALAGIGGGIIITPVLAIYGAYLTGVAIPIHEAVATSLVAVIGTSTATSAVYLEEPSTDIRLGMVLELATTMGAAVAAVVAGFIDRPTLAVIFAVFLIGMAFSVLRRAWTSRNCAPEAVIAPYQPRRYGLGLGASLVAGSLSGLLGIGGGPVKVPVMHLYMGVPLRVATATSNFMIGVTAAASAYIYYGRGDLVIPLAAPVVLGVLVGSVASARLAPRVRGSYILFLLTAIMLYLAYELITRVLRGELA